MNTLKYYWNLLLNLGRKRELITPEKAAKMDCPFPRECERCFLCLPEEGDYIGFECLDCIRANCKHEYESYLPENSDTWLEYCIWCGQEVEECSTNYQQTP